MKKKKPRAQTWTKFGPLKQGRLVLNLQHVRPVNTSHPWPFLDEKQAFLSKYRGFPPFLDIKTCFWVFLPIWILEHVSQ
jgi:hypothetical protein